MICRLSALTTLCVPEQSAWWQCAVQVLWGCSQTPHAPSLNYAPTLQVCSAFVVHTLLNSLMLPEKARLTRSSAAKLYCITRYAVETFVIHRHPAAWRERTGGGSSHAIALTGLLQD